MAKASVCINYNYGLSSTSTQDLPKHKIDIQIPPEVRCFRYVLGVQIPAQKVFGSLGNIYIYMKTSECLHHSGHF